MSAPNRTTDAGGGCEADRIAWSPERLRVYLVETLPGLAGRMQIERTGGGQSNPTFFVTFDNRRLVLRMRPVGSGLLPFAHAIDREYRILNALAGTDVPVPRTLVYCADDGIIGAHFYIMERVEGRVFHDNALPGLSPTHRRAMYLSMAETLARLHCVDWARRGVAGFGKPDGYFARQIARLNRQWELTRTKGIPTLDLVIQWLQAHIPLDSDIGIVHGDPRLANMLFHPTEPRIVAVLDWELSTLGPPLADLAHNCMSWLTTPDEFNGVRDLDLGALGIPSMEDFLAHYRSSGGGAAALTPFHLAFAFFRQAVFLDGIGSRAREGTATAANAAQVGALSGAYAKRALEMIETPCAAET